MQPSETYINERLDHLGIVAGVCQEIGLASYLDGQASSISMWALAQPPWR